MGQTVFVTTFVDNETGFSKTASEVLSSALLRVGSRVTQPVTQTPQPLKAEVTYSQRNVLFENDSEITHLIAGDYLIQVTAHFTLSSGTGNILYLWGEYFDGSDWQPIIDSGREKELDRRNEGEIGYNLNYTVAEGVKIRFRHYIDSGSANLSPNTVPVNGVTIPSVIIDIKQI